MDARLGQEGEGETQWRSITSMRKFKCCVLPTVGWECGGSRQSWEGLEKNGRQRVSESMCPRLWEQRHPSPSPNMAAGEQEAQQLQ